MCQRLFVPVDGRTRCNRGQGEAVRRCAPSDARFRAKPLVGQSPRCLTIASIAALSIVLFSASPARAQGLYSIEDVGVLPGGTFSQANGLNNLGQVVGASSSANGIRGFRYGAGGLVDLGVVPGGASSIAYAVNDVGQIVGQSGTAAAPRAFLYQNGTMSSLGVLPGGTISHASDVNNAGQVVGYSDTGSGASASLSTRTE
jgi:probable HAF family extracellular repeat protein